MSNNNHSSFVTSEEKAKYGGEFVRLGKIVLSLMLTGKAFHRLSQERGTRTIPLQDVDTIKGVMQVNILKWQHFLEFRKCQ